MQRLGDGGGPLAVLDQAGLDTWDQCSKTRVLKLHGSTSWHKAETDSVVADAPKCALDPGVDPIIATPGPSKTRAANSIWPWWDKAAEALAHADVVLFMGYRFPPSDTDARAWLLGAIAKNQRQNLALHTVLGPRLDDDTVRLEQLLRYAAESGDRRSVPKEWTQKGYWKKGPERAPARGYQLEVHRLYAQDFMTVWSRDRFNS